MTGERTRVTLRLEEKGDRTVVAVQHSKLPDAESVAAANLSTCQMVRSLR